MLYISKSFSRITINRNKTEGLEMDILEAAQEQVKKERILRAMVRGLEEMLIMQMSESCESQPTVRELKRKIRLSLAHELDLEVDSLIELGSA